MTAAGWWLLRHAPILGLPGRFAGRSDRPVGAIPSDQARMLVERIGQIDVAVVTPLRRTRETLAGLQAAGLEVPALMVEPGLMEQDFGEWEEQAYDQLAERDPGYWPFWDDPFHACPPGGESAAMLAERALAAWRRLDRELAGKTLLHVGHAGPIRALLTWAEGAAARDALARSVAPLSLARLTGGDWGKPAPAPLVASLGDVVGSQPPRPRNPSGPAGPSPRAEAGSKQT
ncbi:histidine phosphatase family protein [Geminicoccus roseus]|uniref:histidine phosphatase family protein n=1 Tax=Geminicoccus roseus TaxID=404900 RepID=UPI000425A0F4|nr:histidine phosphatase family protein [Geminicoccus roseus]